MDLLTVKDVADQTGLAESTIRNFILRGKIKPVLKIGVNSMFSPDVIQIVNKRNRTPGRRKHSPTSS